MKIHYQTIYIPHLNYRLRIRPLKKIPASLPRAASAYAKREGRCTGSIYLKPNETPSGVAHEVMHILQYIHSDYGMDFDCEFEHMAYLMQWILGKILGYKW